MSAFEDRFPWVFLVIAAFLIVTALLWTTEAISGSKNAYVSTLFIIMHLLGAGVCFSAWHKRRQKKEDGS